jgi:hypothetical protein
MMTEAWENAQKSGAKLKNDPQASTYTKEAHRKLGIVKYDYSWYQEAVKHWEMAAEEPFPDPATQYYLGLAYTSGKGVKKDIKKGKEYLQKASSQGFIQANAVLNHLENKQTLSIKQRGNIEEKNELGLPANAEKDVVQATKPFLNKVFSWFRKYSGPIIGAIAAITITTLAIGAIVGGLIALTISFPHIMVPVWKIVGEVGIVALNAIVTFAKLMLPIVR